jgi:hypothetical protein
LPCWASAHCFFVLPLGYSFNLDGSMMYCSFATLFIAQAYGITLGWGEQITMLLLLLLTSKGMAGVPRASLVMIAGTLSTFNIPEAGLLLIMGVDQFLDMGRSATNVVGNSVAAAVVAKWEGALRPEQPGIVEDAMLEHPVLPPASRNKGHVSALRTVSSRSLLPSPAWGMDLSACTGRVGGVPHAPTQSNRGGAHAPHCTRIFNLAPADPKSKGICEF